MDKGSKTDATKSRLGDDYHLLLALEYCMKAKDGDTVYIEKYGDVSLNRRISVESKHHIKSNHKTSTYHIDIWKTLHNWIESFAEYKSYSVLELVSTSQLSPSNKFIGWNSLTPPKRIDLLKSLSYSSEVPATTQKFAKTVLEFIEEKGFKEKKAFLSRIKFNFNSAPLKAKMKNICSSSFLKGLPVKNRLPYLHKLYGYIIGQRILNPAEWRIDIDDFNSYHVLHNKNYVSDVIPLPDTYKQDSVDPLVYENFRFVKELKDIDLKDKIPAASNDYFRAQKTALMLANDNPLCIRDLQQYQEVDVYERLGYLKDEVGLDLDKDGSEKCSKRCYFRAMQMELLNLMGYDPNLPFFQRGTIQSVVDDDNNEFTWKYKS